MASSYRVGDVSRADSLTSVTSEVSNVDTEPEKPKLATKVVCSYRPVNGMRSVIMFLL